MKKKIIWEKWKDPTEPIIKKARQLEEDEDNLDYVSSRDSFGEDEQEVQTMVPNHGNIGPAIVGPMGIIPLHESNQPSKIFNFWMGHTNFTITHPIKDRIANVNGVETLDIISRYRFRMGIGKAFDQSEVKQKVEKLFFSITSPDKLEQVKAILSQRHAHWAIYVMPNGAIEVAGGGTKAEVEDKGQKYVGKAVKVVTG